MTDFVFVVIFVLGLIYSSWRLIKWANDPCDWSNWMPTLIHGEPGFERKKWVTGYSDDMTVDNRITRYVIWQSISLEDFVGKDFKPVTLTEWQNLYAKKKPYRFHIPGDELRAWRREQWRKLHPLNT